jgi:hypothetical protein
VDCVRAAGAADSVAARHNTAACIAGLRGVMGI